MWLAALSAFGNAAKARFEAAGLSRAGLVNPGDLELRDDLFFKPVRGEGSETSTHRASLARILDVYDHLKRSAAAGIILFPLGTVQLPRIEAGAASELGRDLRKCIREDLGDNFRSGDDAALTPLLVYERLFPPWSSIPPAPNTAKAATYTRCVADAVAACSDAGVVLLDLRPANIMWNGTTEQVKLIDFEDAVRVGTVISPTAINQYKTDRDARYVRADEAYAGGRPSLAINDHFVASITAFMLRDDPDQTFQHFMFQRHVGQQPWANGAGSGGSSSSVSDGGNDAGSEVPCKRGRSQSPSPNS